ILINQYLVNSRENSPGMKRLQATIGNLDKPDHRILASTIYVKEQVGKNVILVSKDGNMAMKALALGIQSEDYLNDKVMNAETDNLKECKIGVGAFDNLLETGESKITPRQATKLSENEYIYVHDGSRKSLACFNGPKEIRTLIIPDFHTALGIPKGNKVFCKNDEQLIFMDALLNPEVKIVTCKGKAGTGKTFLAIASALAQTLGMTYNGGFERVYISRPTVEIGKDPGALPGDKDAKMAPYMQNYFDNLEVLFSKRNTIPESLMGKAASQRKKKREMAKRQNHQIQAAANAEEKFESFLPVGKPYNFLLESGIVQIEALAYIRGRSISNTFFILDEVQNLTPGQTKAAVTRLANGSKMV
ncbi:MAG: PhoH family protein, partial [Verrucomicrobiae bacterium]|nr:PhoH family protein [Verrucomicrobiae bacterium]